MYNFLYKYGMEQVGPLTVKFARRRTQMAPRIPENLGVFGIRGVPGDALAVSRIQRGGASFAVSR